MYMIKWRLETRGQKRKYGNIRKTFLHKSPCERWSRNGIHISISRLAICKRNREAPSFHKFQQFSKWLQKNCNWKWKFATESRK